MATPNYVQVPPNSTGLKIDTSEITTATGNVVERQNVVISDPSNPTQLADITSLNALAVDIVGSANLAEIIYVMRKQEVLLEAILIQLGGVPPTIVNS